MKTLLYGYSLVTMKESAGNSWLTDHRPSYPSVKGRYECYAETMLEFYDTIERIVIRDCSLVGPGMQFILQGELGTV